MEILLAVIGSSAFSIIITTILNMLQGRKKDILSYITEERKQWREKIRKIAQDIQNSDNKNKIEEYLTQLQLNINSYGRTAYYDYVHDGHIWHTIEELKRQNDIIEFQKSKELLLFYISLMLKEDWERSKKEVNGYSKVIKYIILQMILIFICAVFYFWVLNFEDGLVFFGIIVLNIILFGLFIIYFFDDLLKLSNAKEITHILSISKIHRRNKKVRKKMISLSIFLCVFMMILFCGLGMIIPKSVMHNMRFNLNSDDSIEIYTNLNNDIFRTFSKELEREIEKKYP